MTDEDDAWAHAEELFPGIKERFKAKGLTILYPETKTLQTLMEASDKSDQDNGYISLDEAFVVAGVQASDKGDPK